MSSQAQPQLFQAVVYPRNRKVACVLLQAVYGGDSSVPSKFWDTSQWQLHPPDEKPYMAKLTKDEWKLLSEAWLDEDREQQRK